jgi:uncharacterized protein YegP (UPF0339 family)
MSTRRPKFVIKPSADGQWVYQYVGANGEPMMGSETVQNKGDALDSVTSIQRSAHEAVVEIQDADGNVVERLT